MHTNKVSDSNKHSLTDKFGLTFLVCLLNGNKYKEPTTLKNYIPEGLNLRVKKA